ncbi:MAG: hypothetical protein ISS69_14155 [Phycisphaerae bacterium]|nr:hypothetical protein [Phycisphaerae bacterium]
MNVKRTRAMAAVVLAGMLGLWLVTGSGGQLSVAMARSPVSGVKVPGYGRLLVSGPFLHKNMAVFFLYEPAASGDETDYMTLQEAFKGGLVKISERSDATVRQLVITYDGDKPLFIIAGELVSGGKQDRTMQHSLVIPPETKNAPLPSFCVEQTRWRGGGKFEVTGDMASNSSQAALNIGDQSSVWSSVRKYKSSLRGNASVASGTRVRASRTSSLNEELSDGSVKKLVGGYEEAMGRVALDIRRPLGLAYAVDGKMTAMHVFNSSILFKKLRAQLLRAGSVDAAAGRFNKKPTNLTVRDLANFIAAAWDGKKSTLEPGMDNLVTRYVASRTFTSELRYKARLVHSQVGRIETPVPKPKPYRVPRRNNMNMRQSIRPRE